MSDYRDAYAHVDPNVPNRNILASTSSYICALSSVQDFRKEVAIGLKSTVDTDTYEYLKSMEDYGNFWYANLAKYTESTFTYIMRAVTKKPAAWEEKHEFYIRKRNPGFFTSNSDLLDNLSCEYCTDYFSNFILPLSYSTKIISMYQVPLSILYNNLTDKKSIRKISKLDNLGKLSNEFYQQGKFLDLLNTSEFATLKLNELRKHIHYNINNYSSELTVNNMFGRFVYFTENLFENIFNSVKGFDIVNVRLRGYKKMRKFEIKL